MLIKENLLKATDLVVELCTQLENHPKNESYARKALSSLHNLYFSLSKPNASTPFCCLECDYYRDSNIVKKQCHQCRKDELAALAIYEKSLEDYSTAKYRRRVFEDGYIPPKLIVSTYEGSYEDLFGEGGQTYDDKIHE